MLLGTLGASLLGNILAGKGIVRAGSGRHSFSAAPLTSSSYVNKKGKEIVRAGYGKNRIFNTTSFFDKF